MSILDQVLKDEKIDESRGWKIRPAGGKGRMVKVPKPVNPLIRQWEKDEPWQLAEFKYEYKWVEDE